MQNVDDQDVSPVVIAVMGMTGTGKSTFIRLLTGDDTINIGHGPTSETSAIQVAHYVDKKTGRAIVFIDIPGFDNSWEITDTDILEMISLRLGPGASPRPQLNGLIYMHRISDPRVGGTSLKNLRMFRALCGDENLANVRIVTTNWNRVSEQEGKDRAEALANETFKPLLEGKAKILRHDNNLVSAEEIVSEFIPLLPITTQLERELKAGKKFNETSAGAVLTEEMTKMQEKHAEELTDLQKDMEEAERALDRAWKAELEEERRELQRKMAKAEHDRRRLERTLVQAHLEARSQLATGQPGAGTQSNYAAWHWGQQPIRAKIKQSVVGQCGAALDHNQGRERDWRSRQGTVQSPNTPARGGYDYCSLCSDENLANVRAVTTNWCRISEQEGTDRAEALRNEAFKPLLDAGAKMLRHDNNLSSTEKVMSKLIPLPPITTQLGHERHEGRKLSETSADSVLGEEIARLQEKHAEELVTLKKTMEEAGEVINRTFTSELGKVHRHMEQVVQSSEKERQILGDTIQQLRAEVSNLKEELDGQASRARA